MPYNMSSQYQRWILLCTATDGRSTWRMKSQLTSDNISGSSKARRQSGTVAMSNYLVGRRIPQRLFHLRTIKRPDIGTGVNHWMPSYIYLCMTNACLSVECVGHCYLNLWISNIYLTFLVFLLTCYRLISR